MMSIGQDGKNVGIAPKVVYGLVLALSVVMLILNAWFLYYVYELEKRGCKCALGWRRTFIEVYLALFFLSIVVGFFLSVDGGKWMALAMSILLLVYVVVTRQFIDQMRQTHCTCAETDAFNWLNIINWIFILESPGRPTSFIVKKRLKAIWTTVTHITMSVISNDDRRVPVSEVDYLEEDPPLAGQRFACMSFLSPKDAVASREAFGISKFHERLATDVAEMLDQVQEVFADNISIQETVSLLRERHALLWDPKALQQELRSFEDENSERLNEEFVETFSKYNTCVHAFKVRGVFSTQEEAMKRVSKLKSLDSRIRVFVTSVGMWCPWNPGSKGVPDQEYEETEVNTLMKKYNEMQDEKDALFASRKDFKMKAMEQSRDVWLERIKAGARAQAMVDRESVRIEDAGVEEASVEEASVEEASVEEASVDDAGVE
ncbi:hypothetical protein CEUSTIGMA_g13096.t1 [Chlamydomonas eustigma]|uniref:Uncharacterized protein n=1 Tax=Chlamydomonas eustigma TaxID=1157962 RepID=A0A250XRX0_9CHLO|nr:hypothetical protein CEUSTIGMA_g13096.t1 [Chlamydomonas eustigma]|eukprot:GAX85682.1 hypothetical protein CEUSTIGMA_g13096.t1 [Chlamydomonas eustigma]